MNAIRHLREKAAVTQGTLAEAGGTSQPTIAAYEAGRKSPTMDTVSRLARGLGFEARMEFYPALTREERRSLHLHRAIGKRLAEDPERVLKQARKNLVRMRLVGSRSSRPLREWGVLLDRPLDSLVALLVDPDPWARELRHVSPFAGVLTAAERARVYDEWAREDARGL